jgi:hypothetical protein
MLSQKHHDEEGNQSKRAEGKKNHKGRRKKRFGEKISKKKPRKKIQFQTGGFNAFSFRR